MSGRDCRDLDTAWLHLAKGFTNGHLSPQVSTGETQVLASSSPAFSWQCPHLPCSPGSPLFMCLVMQCPFSCAWLQAWPSLPWDMRGAPWLSGLGAYIMDVRTGHSNVCYRQGHQQRCLSYLHNHQNPPKPFPELPHPPGSCPGWPQLQTGPFLVVHTSSFFVNVLCL